MTWRKKSDANQQEIIDALRQTGMSVESIHREGRGIPDLLVGWAGKTYLLEVKTPDGRLTPAERVWLREWKGHATIVHSIEEALDVVMEGAEDE